MEVFTYWQDKKNCRILAGVIGGGILGFTAHGFWRKRRLKARLRGVKKKDDASRSDEPGKIKKAGIFQGLALAGPHFSRSWFPFSSSVTWSSVVVISSYMMIKHKSNVNDYIGKLGGLVVNGHSLGPTTYGFVLASLCAAAWNALVKFSVDRLTLTIRGKITRRMHRNYVEPLRIQRQKFNVTQIVVSDINEFSGHAASMLHKVAIPIVSVSIYSTKLVKRLGPKPLLICISYMLLSHLWLRMVVPTSSQSAMLRSTCEGNFQKEHTRVCEYAEEIEFFRGSMKERQLLDQSYNMLEGELTTVSNNMLHDSLLRDFFQRYLGILVSFLCILPSAQASESPTEFFLNSLHDLINIGSGMLTITKAFKDGEILKGLARRLLDLEAALKELSSSPVPKDSTNVILEGVRIDAPDGKILISQANLEVKAGIPYLIAGPNGSGKSSLLRVLSGVWPVRFIGDQAIFEIPRQNFFVPQRSYLIPNFTPVQQILYPSDEPESHSEELKLKIRDCLKLCGLSQIIIDLDVPFPWETLSGGQKELVCMCRAMFRLPEIKLLVLDEAISQVSKDYRKRILRHILETCREQGLTLLIVSHDQLPFQDEFNLILIDDGAILQNGRKKFVFEKENYELNTKNAKFSDPGQQAKKHVAFLEAVPSQERSPLRVETN